MTDRDGFFKAHAAGFWIITGRLIYTGTHGLPAAHRPVMGQPAPTKSGPEGPPN